MNSSMYILVICLCVGMVVTDDCVDIPAAANFTMSKFQGRWYEIGKIQTAGGAFFQRECVCNSLFVEPDTTKTNGDGKVHYSCRKNVPTGDYMNMTADLTDMKAPGKWNQQFFWYVPKVSWTVIIQGEDYAIEYDCGGTLFGLITNYCIHVMSRKPTQDPAVTQKLIEFAEGLGLNPYKLPFERIKHDGCW